MNLLFRRRRPVLRLAAGATPEAVRRVGTRGAEPDPGVGGAAGERHDEAARRLSASEAERAALLVRALEASIAGDSGVVKDLYTSDVQGWSPALSVSSAAELAVELEDVETAFSDAVLDVRPLQVGGDQACVEWTATVTHSGPLIVDEDLVIAPTGRRCTVHGVTIAEFEGDRIRSFRHYSDEIEALCELGLLPES